MFASNVIGCTPSEIRVGMPVEVVFEDVDGECTAEVQTGAVMQVG